MRGFSERTHFALYLTGLSLLAVALPLSTFLISVAQITLTVNWLLEGNFREKWLKVKEGKAVWIISLFYLVHLLGMFYTSDFNWGFHDLRIKLPMLALPLIIGTSKPLEDRYLKNILNIFMGALVMVSIIVLHRYIHIHNHTIPKIAESFDLMDNIRLGLMVNLSIFSIFWLFSYSQSKLKWCYIPVFAWFIVFLLILQTLTGVFLFIIISFILLIRIALRSDNLIFRWFMLISAITMLLLVGSYSTKTYARFFSFEPINQASIEKSTIHGNPYQHDFNKKEVENGHYINLYLCESELRTEWNKRSHFAYDSLNRNGQELKYPLIRYLTSKGLRKDEEGVKHLTEKDIRDIEWGMTNYIYDQRYSIYPRIYTAFWELYNYHLGDNPTGYSISQRIEAVKTAIHIIKKDFWLGVGTGDVCVAFEQQYEIDKSPLSKEKRLRAHNQFVTFFLTFGVIGFTIILVSLFIPVFIGKKLGNYLFLLIFLIGFLSFLNEDTLETHAGISFFAFFYSLFLFRKNP